MTPTHTQSHSQLSSNSGIATPLNDIASDYIRVKQINLHHCKSATYLIDIALQKAQTKKQKTIVLIQEPYIDVLGFNKQYCNVLYHNRGTKSRTCIVATKDVPITIQPQYCDGDITTVLCTSTDGTGDEFILSSGYMPSDTDEQRPGYLISDLVKF